MTHHSLRHLSDDLLSSGLDASASDDRLANATLLAHIAEFDRRRLYLPTKYPSMFRYCLGHLRMSEDIAFKRVRVARVARRFPVVFDAIVDGRLNLSGVMLLARRLTRSNGGELIEAAMNRSRAEIKELLARRFPEAGPPAIPATANRGAEGSTPTSPAPELLAGAADEPELKTAPNAQAPGPVEIAGVLRAPAPNSLPELQARVRPVAPGRYELVAIIDQETHDQLEAARELLGHAVPGGALIEVLERAITLQYAHLRKRRCGSADRPRTRTNGSDAAPRRSGDPRHVPDAVRRTVWERDGGRCAFTTADGQRCEERSCIELDHVVPIALGGRSTVENLRLLCRAHNQHAAERTLGREHMTAKREAARHRRAAERFHKDAERRWTAQRRVEIERQREELGEAFRQLGYRGRDLEQALAWCATKSQAPLEERLRYALGCMAPRARTEPGASGNAA